MPVERGYTTRDGERVGYYRWGESGKMYTYTTGDEEEREEARERARAQRRAAYASGYDG
jgi:hypothetical protein